MTKTKDGSMWHQAKMYTTWVYHSDVVALLKSVADHITDLREDNDGYTPEDLTISSPEAYRPIKMEGKWYPMPPNDEGTVWQMSYSL